MIYSLSPFSLSKLVVVKKQKNKHKKRLSYIFYMCKSDRDVPQKTGFCNWVKGGYYAAVSAALFQGTLKTIHFIVMCCKFSSLHVEQSNSTQFKTSLINHSLFTGPGIYAKVQGARVSGCLLKLFICRSFSIICWHAPYVVKKIKVTSLCGEGRAAANEGPKA